MRQHHFADANDAMIRVEKIMFTLMHFVLPVWHFRPFFASIGNVNE